MGLETIANFDTETMRFIVSVPGDPMIFRQGDHSYVLPALVFHPKAEDRYTKIQELIQSSQKDKKHLILEVGPGSRLSPIQTAAKFDNTTVIAIDKRENFFTSKISPGTHRFDPSNIRANGSWAAFFNGDLFEMVDEIKEAPFEAVHLICPPPSSDDMILKASQVVRPGGRVVSVTVDWDQDMVAEQLKQLGFDVSLTSEANTIVTALTGIADSHFINPVEHPDLKATILVAIKAV